jgi:hypothetical protein
MLGDVEPAIDVAHGLSLLGGFPSWRREGACPGFEMRSQLLSALAEYGSAPSRFMVTSVLDAQPIHNGTGGWRLSERHVAVPYEKD